MLRYAKSDMNIYAASIGTPRYYMNFRAEVHSVFSNAVNLLIEDSDEIVSILFRNDNDQPGDIRIGLNQHHILKHFFPGQSIQCQNDIIKTDNSSIKIMLNQAKLVECGFISQSKVTTEIIENSIYVIRDTLKEKHLANKVIDDLYNLFSVKVECSLETLMEAMGSSDMCALDRAVQGLIGLGAGLTPSGDDVLVGLMAGFEINKTLFHQRLTNQISNLRSLVLSHIGKTNRISRKYLRYAAYGYFSTDILDLLKSIGNKESQAVIRNAVQKVVMAGHTSGADTLMGIATALEILLIYG